MSFTVDALFAYARQHEKDEWRTLRRKKRFQYRVTDRGIQYIPNSGRRHPVSSEELASFCDEFWELASFASGDYPDSYHKSYSLPLIQRFLRSRDQHS